MCSHGGKQNKQSDQTKCYIEKSAWDQACDDDENSLCVCVCDVRMFGAFVSFFIRYVYNNFPVSILIVRILLLFSIKLSIASAMQQDFCAFLLLLLLCSHCSHCSLCYLNEIVHKLCKNIYVFICICVFAFMIFIVNFILIKLSARVRLRIRNRIRCSIDVDAFSFFAFLIFLPFSLALSPVQFSSVQFSQY